MRKEQKRKKLHKDQKGFSLTEVLIAMMILAIIAIPICHSFVTAARTNAKARKLACANAVAENVMEGINAYSYEDILVQFSDSVSADDFLISHNCDVKGVLSGLTPEGDCTNTMVYRIGGVEEDVYAFDVKVTVDASFYVSDVPGDPLVNDQGLTSITNYNSAKDYLFVLSKEDEIAAYQALAGRTGSHEYSEFYGKVERCISLTVTKGNDGTKDFVRLTNTVTYTYVGAEGWLSGSDGVYTRNYGTVQYSGDELLRNAYICYLPCYSSTLSNPGMDRIVIENADNAPVTFFLLKQIDDTGVSLEAKENQYVPTIELTEGKWEAGQSCSYASFHTNYDYNLETNGLISGGVKPVFKYSYTDQADQAVAITGDSARALMNVEGAVATVSGNRLYQVTVEVYEAGAYDHFEDGTVLQPITVISGN